MAEDRECRKQTGDQLGQRPVESVPDLCRLGQDCLAHLDGTAVAEEFVGLTQIPAKQAMAEKVGLREGESAHRVYLEHLQRICRDKPPAIRPQRRSGNCNPT
jgi:hypothetical protein